MRTAQISSQNHPSIFFLYNDVNVLTLVRFLVSRPNEKEPFLIC